MKTKILVLASNPSGTEQLKLNPEIRSIRDSYERSQKRDKFIIVPEPAVRISDLQRIILSEKPQIVHFCGHGSGHQGLILENDQGESQAVSTEALTDLLKILKNRIECVILNACHSHVQGKQINQHINYLIATKKEIRDDAALLFTKGFYDALFNDMTYKEAYELGCNRIHLELYKSNNSGRKLVPVYSEEKSDYIDLEQHEILLFLEKNPPNLIENDIPRSKDTDRKNIEVSQSPQESSKAKDLGEQMRGWFEALNYSFEEYEIWKENYFEWIINVPGRRRYDRILVRGVAGEANIKDFQELSDLVTEHRTDEGWLVAFRRVSNAVHREQQKSETNKIYCYTFDELLDDVAQFDGYIQWLTEEIQRRKIDIQYVPLACTKD